MARTKRYIPDHCLAKSYGKHPDGTPYEDGRWNTPRDRWLQGRDKHWSTHRRLEDDWDGPMLKAKRNAGKSPRINEDFDNV